MDMSSHSECKSCDSQKPSKNLTERQQDLQLQWTDPGLAPWMTQPSQLSQDSELTSNYEANPTQTATFIFDITALIFIFLETNVFQTTRPCTVLLSYSGHLHFA